MNEEKTVTSTRDTQAGEVLQLREAEAALRQIGAVMQAMAGTVTELRAEVHQLRAQVAQLEKLTPMQVKTLNLMIRERARVLSIDYCTGPAQPVCTAIRRALRMETGARSVKDIARCDWQVAQEIVETWEEPQTLRKIADKLKE